MSDSGQANASRSTRSCLHLETIEALAWCVLRQISCTFHPCSESTDPIAMAIHVICSK